MSDALVINEIYLSLQGESTFAGLPCIFVRLTACNLRCSYCDTAYAFAEGERKSLQEVQAEVKRLAEPFDGARTAKTEEGRGDGTAPASGYRLPLVELPGGETLVPKGCLPLIKCLTAQRF